MFDEGAGGVDEATMEMESGLRSSWHKDQRVANWLQGLFFGMDDQSQWM